MLKELATPGDMPLIHYQPQFSTLNATEQSMSSSSVAPTKLTQFHLFSWLPTELQLKILELAHPYNKKHLITATLHEDYRFDSDVGKQTVEPHLYQQTNHLGNIISGLKYHAVLHQRPYFTPLLWINRQSRSVALRRYHVRVPLRPGNKSDDLYLYINPECDTIHLDAFKVSASTLIGFLHDIRAHDVRGKGLSHLAINNHFDSHLSLIQTISPESLREVEVDSFIQTLSALRQLWFINLLDISNRFTRTKYQLPTGPMAYYRSTGLNRAIPIFPEASEFDLVPTDPRPIKPFLKQLLFTGRDPRLSVQRWESMETRFGGGDRFSLEREISYIIAVDATEKHETCMNLNHSICRDNAVRNFKSLDKYLQNEIDIAGYLMKRGEEDKMQNPSAAGFWIFPQGVLDLDGCPVRMGSEKSAYDLSSRTPALGLFHLS